MVKLQPGYTVKVREGSKYGITVPGTTGIVRGVSQGYGGDRVEVEIDRRHPNNKQYAEQWSAPDVRLWPLRIVDLELIGGPW